MSQKGFDSDRFYQRWVNFHCLLGLSGGFVIAKLISINVWLVMMAVSFFIYLSKSKKMTNQLPLIFGYANIITTFRLFLIWSAIFFSHSIPPLFLFIVFFLAILLDGLDGFVARKFNHTSLFGERLDMEVDALLVATLSLHHFLSGFAPIWLLLPGFMRYLFGLISSFRSVNREFTSKKFRATIAVIFFFSLILPFVLPTSIALPILQIGGSLILFSFGLSFLGMFSKRDFHQRSL